MCIYFSLTASIKPVHAGDVVAAHLCGASKGKVRVALSDDGWFAVSGEGVSGGGHKHNIVDIQSCTHTHTHTHTHTGSVLTIKAFFLHLLSFLFQLQIRHFHHLNFILLDFTSF